MKLSPEKMFFMHANVVNLDGTIEPEMEIPNTAKTLEEIIFIGKNDVTDNPGTVAYIYECRPIRRIAHGPVRVQIIKAVE